MARTYRIIATGQSGDALMESLLTNSDITIVSNFVHFPTGTASKRCQIAVGSSGSFLGNNVVNTLSIGEMFLSGAPTAPIVIIADGHTTLAADPAHYFVSIGTDKKVKVTTYNGTVVASSTSTVSTSSASPTEVVVHFDCTTLSTIWVSILINNVEEAAVDSGLSYTQFFDPSSTSFIGQQGVIGDWTGSGAGGRGASFDARYITIFTSTGADRPHLAANPRLRGVAALVMTANGDVTAWPNGTGTGFAEIDDPTGNDGDTTTIADLQSPGATSHSALYKEGTTNPLPGGATVVGAQMHFIGRYNGASAKLYCNPLVKLSGTTAEYSAGTVGGPNVFTTTYAGTGIFLALRPDGTAWANTDWDLSGGVGPIQTGVKSVVSGSTDMGSRVTRIIGMAPVYYTATMPVTTTPGATVAERRIFIT